MDLHKLDSLAAKQHGVVTRAQAKTLGICRSSWYRALESGLLVQLHPGVARVIGAAATWEQRAYAAVAAAGDGAEGSHRTAVRLLGVPRPDGDPIDITVPADRRPYVEGAVIHRPKDRLRLKPIRKSGIPCTNQLRTLVDLGAVAPESVAAAFEAFVIDGSIKPGVAKVLLDEHGRRGRHGIAALREALDQWPLGDDVPDSVLEVEMAKLLTKYRLPPAVFHTRLAGYEVDFQIAGTPIVIECDGWQHHVANRDQWEFDLERGARLAADGYVVLHRTRRQIMFRQRETAARIRALVQRWAPSLLR